MKVDIRFHVSLTKRDVESVTNACNSVSSLYPYLLSISVKSDNLDLGNFRQLVQNGIWPISSEFVIAENVLEHLMNKASSPITGLFTNVVFYSKTDNLFPMVAYGYDFDKRVGSFVISVDALRDVSFAKFARRITVNTLHAIGIIITHTNCHTPRCPLNYQMTTKEMDVSNINYCEKCLERIRANSKI